MSFLTQIFNFQRDRVGVLSEMTIANNYNKVSTYSPRDEMTSQIQDKNHINPLLNKDVEQNIRSVIGGELEASDWCEECGSVQRRGELRRPDEKACQTATNVALIMPKVNYHERLLAYKLNKSN